MRVFDELGVVCKNLEAISLTSTTNLNRFLCLVDSFCPILVNFCESNPLRSHNKSS